MTDSSGVFEMPLPRDTYRWDIRPSEWIQHQDFPSTIVSADLEQNFNFDGAMWKIRAMDSAGSPLDSILIYAYEGGLENYSLRYAKCISAEDGAGRMLVCPGSMYTITAKDARAHRTWSSASGKTPEEFDRDNEERFARVRSLRIDNVRAGRDSTLTLTMEPVRRR